LTGVGSNYDGKCLGVAPPQPPREAVQDVVHAERGGEQRQPVGIRDRAHDQALDDHAEQRTADHRQQQRDVIIESELLEQEQRDERGDHREIALGEVDRPVLRNTTTTATAVNA
jgi:hypothetical protein